MDLERYRVESIDDVALVMPDGERVPLCDAEAEFVSSEPSVEYLNGANPIQIAICCTDGTEIEYSTSYVTDRFYLIGDRLYLEHTDGDGRADTVLIWDYISEADISYFKNMLKGEAFGANGINITENGCEECARLKEAILQWKSL